MESLFQNFFLISHMFPWLNKLLITENIFLPHLIKQEAAGICTVSFKVFKP